MYLIAAFLTFVWWIETADRQEIYRVIRPDIIIGISVLAGLLWPLAWAIQIGIWLDNLFKD